MLTLGREVMHMIYAYGPQSGRPDKEKVHFCGKMASQWDLGVLVKSSFLWGISMGI